MNEWPLTAARSDPNGALIRFDITSPRPIRKVIFDLLGDSEPGVEIEMNGAADNRFNRAFAPKFVVNGTYPLRLTAINDLGQVNCSSGSQAITVVF